MVRARVVGRDRLNRKLKALPAQSRKRVRQAMEESADDIVALMKASVPVDSGALRDSIGWTWGGPPERSISLIGFAGGGPSDDLMLTIYAGDEDAFYARWVEFGTQAGLRGQRVADKGAGVKQASAGRLSYRTHPGTPAQPFFFSSYQIRRSATKQRIAQAMREAAREVAKS